MLEINDIVIEFKFNGEVKKVKEISIEVLEKLEKRAKEESFNEISLFKELMTLIGLDIETVNKMSLRQMKILADAIKEVK